MFRLVTLLFLCVSLPGTGCTGQAQLGPHKDEASYPAATQSEPLSPLATAGTVRAQDSTSGKNLQIVTNPPSEISQVVRSIFEDSANKLWIGTQTGLYCHDGDKLTCFMVVNDSGKGVTIKQVVEDKDGNIWCATTGGVTRIDGESYTSFGEKDGLIDRDVWSIAADATGMIWIGTINGVCRFDGKKFTPFAIPEAKPDLTRGVTSANIVHCITCLLYTSDAADE